MKIKISKATLVSLVGKTLNIVEKRNTMPVLVNVLLEAQKNTLKIFSTNLEVSLTDEVNCETLTPGKVAVSAKNLFDIIKEMPEGELTLERQENNWLKINLEKSVFNIVGISPEEYPVFPAHKTTEFITLDSKVMSDMIDKTIFSVSNDETRYHLNGVYFERKLSAAGLGYLMVATDGHRLSLVNKGVENKDNKNSDGVIIPRKGLVEIHKLLQSIQGDFKIAIEGSQLIVCHGPTVLMIRLIEGKYPNYRQLIPQNLNETIHINRAALLSSLKRVSLLSNQKSKGVTLNFSNGKLEITSNNPELGDAREEIAVLYKGNDLKIGFNAKYIMDVLTSIEDEEIDLDLKDQLSPGVVRPKADKNYTCVIMPMRI
jgi:DNA polymerase-3 subunit beta